MLVKSLRKEREKEGGFERKVLELQHNLKKV